MYPSPRAAQRERTADAGRCPIQKTPSEAMSKAPAGVRQIACPICRRPAVAAFRPFCSRRCADIDLARWLGGAYAIPGEPADLAEDTEAAPAAEEPDAKPGARR
jgi:endogenous inhibitor of DNA gyrase (YacG/DUF329 family)